MASIAGSVGAPLGSAPPAGRTSRAGGCDNSNCHRTTQRASPIYLAQFADKGSAQDVFLLWNYDLYVVSTHSGRQQCQVQLLRALLGTNVIGLMAAHPVHHTHQHVRSPVALHPHTLHCSVTTVFSSVSSARFATTITFVRRRRFDRLIFGDDHET